MNRVYFIPGSGGHVKKRASDFPLSIGGGTCDIRLPGVADDHVLGFFALSEDHAYIQSAGEHIELFHNHEHLASSAWLKSGDRIQYEQLELAWEVKGDQVSIGIRKTHQDSGLEPPATSPPDSGINVFEDDGAEGPEEIIPIRTPPIPPAKRRRLRNVLWVFFALLLTTALFIVFATPVSISVSPEPESQKVSGFPPPVSLAGKKLAIPGSYTVRATRKGYFPLEQRFDVASGGFQAFTFEMEELPGRLQVNVQPDVPVSVMVDGAAATVEAGNIITLLRGARQVWIETERYLEEVRELEIEGYGVLQTIDIPLQPAWADVSIDTLPQGATVMVDGVSQGTTPLNIQIIQGRREITLQLEAYKPLRFLQQFAAGGTVIFEAFELEPNDGTLVLKTRPAGATVSVNGEYAGSSPVSLALVSGKNHRLQLSKPGYLPVEKSITLEADEERQLFVEMPGEFGIVFANSKPADADLAVDGKLAGKGTQRLRLTTRPHELTFSKPGYTPQTVKVTPRKDTSQNIDVVLKTVQQAKEEARPRQLRTASGQELVLIEPKGTFKMGASRREAGRRANESRRLVELTRRYFLSRNEVTNAEYRQFKSEHSSGTGEGVSLNGDSMPVVNISWNDAARYCNWLSQQDGLPPSYIEQDDRMVLSPDLDTGYRLPTEAEWTYAARVVSRPSPARYPWGDTYPPTIKAGNYADARIADTLANTVAGYNDGYRGPAPVGSFDAAPAGFHDLGGNVAEWIHDYYAVYPGQSNRLVQDPMGPATGDHHVVRGSSWRDGSIAELRLSYRDYSRGPRDDLGFRIARYADD